MSHSEHLGKAYANIVYAFLTSIDYERYDDSMLRLFHRESAERSALFDFLMRKRAHGPVNFSVEFLSAGEPSSLWQLERSIATNDLVALLTIVRNLYLENFCQNMGSASVPCESDVLCDAAKLSSIPVAPPRGLSDGGVPLIKTVVVSLCECLRQGRHRGGVFSRMYTAHSLSYAAAGAAQRSSLGAGPHRLRLFAATVEAVWAYSLCAVLAPRDSAFVRSGGVLLREWWRRPAASAETLPRLSDAPPALFLSCALCERLAAHLRERLLAPLAPGPAAWRRRLLTGACFAHVTAADGAGARAEWQRLVCACAAPDGSGWEQVVANAAEDIAAAWQRHSAEWSSDAAGALPLVLSKELPALAAVGVEEAVAAVAAGVAGAGRTEKNAPVDGISVAYGFVQQLCHVYGFIDNPHVQLSKILELVNRMLVAAKKDKRIRELIAAALAGCILADPITETTNPTEKTLHDWVENVLVEIENWRKLKNGACYLITAVALLNGCSTAVLLNRLPGIFENISMWFSAVDASDQFVILYATIHAVGLLTEVIDRSDTRSKSFPEELGVCIEKFKQCVDAILIKGIARECGRPDANAVAAFDLLMLALQHPLFLPIASEDWLPRLLRSKPKSKHTSKVLNGSAALSSGQMIAMWVICALFEMTEQKNTIMSLGLPVSELPMAGVHGAESVFSAFNTAGNTRERLSAIITTHGSRFASVVASVDYLTLIWRGNCRPQSVLLQIRALPAVRRAIDDIRKDIFRCIPLYQQKRQQLLFNVRRDVDGEAAFIGESTNHLVHVVRAMCFWGPPHAVLDRSLAIPLQLAWPSTLLHDAVARDILPFFLHHADDSMTSSALALHRLAESIIVCLSAGEDDCVEPLTVHLMSFLLRTADHWTGVVSGECGSSLDHQHHQSFSSRTSTVQCEAASVPGSARWEWLFSPLHVPSPDDEWRVFTALRGSVLFDTLEAVALVLLGHSSRRVRRAALRQLGILATLARLHQEAEAEKRKQMVSSSMQAPTGEPETGATFVQNGRGQLETATIPDQKRVSIADVIGELEDYFSQRYEILRDRYFAMFCAVKSDEDANNNSTSTPSNDDALPDISLFDDVVFESRGGLGTATAERTTLENSAFGVLCLAEDCNTPLYVFTSALALTMVKYCYRPGSASIRVACAVAGEIALTGARHHMERSRALSSTWDSCYVLYGVLVLVDNTNFSPDANRLTHAAEQNRPGHHHGGNVTFVGGAVPDSGVIWQIVNRQCEYNQLLMDITLPLLRFEFRIERSVIHFADVVQYLFAGPIGLAPDASLVIFTGILTSSVTIANELLEILSMCSNSRNSKQFVAHASLSVLFPFLQVVGKRFFVSPPFVTGAKENFIAMKRSQMELIIEEVIEKTLFGEDTEQDDVFLRNDSASTYTNPIRANISVQSVGRILNPGHGVSVRSWLVLPFLPPVLGDGGSFENILSEMTPVIVLRGFFCELLHLLYTDEAQFFEPHLKSRLLEKVITSLSLQVNWFMWTQQSCICVNSSSVALQSPIRHRMSMLMEKTIAALQTVIHSVCSPTSGLRVADTVNTLNAFSCNFFKWLQETLHRYGDLGSVVPGVFDLAVTLLTADPSSRALVGVVLCKAPLGSPIHSTLFAALAKSVLEPLSAGEPRQSLNAKSSFGQAIPFMKPARSNPIYDARSTVTPAAFRGVLDDSGSILVFYALAYLYEDAVIGALYDSPTRQCARELIEFLGGDVLPGAALLEEGLYLLRRTNRRGGSVEYTAFLVQSLFRMAATEILEAGRKTKSPFQLQRIALRLLGLVIESVEATRENLSVIMQVTKVCRGKCPDEALAALWGGWVAYEGHERERFISLLVAIPFDLDEKRIITLYIDKYINNEMSKLEKESRGGLGDRSSGVYYSFLFFCLYQVRILREDVVRTDGAELHGNAPAQPEQRDGHILKERRHSSQPMGNPSDASQMMRSSLTRSRLGSYPAREFGSAHPCASTRGPLWVVHDNIWWDAVETPIEARDPSPGQSPSPSSVKEFKTRENPNELRTRCFAAPAASVLLFTTWAIERLNVGAGYDRLWRALQRDMQLVSKYVTMTSALGELQQGFSHASGDRGAPRNNTAMSVAWSHPSTEAKYDGEDKVGDEDELEEDDEEDDDDEEQEGVEGVGDDDIDDDVGNKDVFSQNHCQRSSDVGVSPSDAVTDVTGGENTKELNKKYNHEADEYKSNNGSVASDETVIIHQNVSAETVTEAMKANLNGSAARPKSVVQLSQAKASTRGLQRDCAVMLLHLASVLLVHFARSAHHSPVVLRVIESAFEVIGGQLSSGGAYRMPVPVRRWLHLTGRRLAARDSGAAGAFGDADLSVEASLRAAGGLAQAAEPMGGCPCVSVDVALVEFFLGLAGHGRNRRGRSFVVRCLHESSAWASGDCARLNDPRRAVHTYIVLLSLKIARSLSSCLAGTSGVAIEACEGSEQWMERTPMAVAAADVFRKLLAALARHVATLSSSKLTLPVELLSVSLSSSLPPNVQLLLCRSVMTSLGCLLRDILLHEMHCTAVMPFAANNAFPTRYMHSFFWTGFALLTAPRLWPSACDLLAVYHRYGCTRLFGSVEVPALAEQHRHALRMDEAPECAAVQLVLLQQGLTIHGVHSSSKHTNSSLDCSRKRQDGSASTRKSDSNGSKSFSGPQVHEQLPIQWCCEERRSGASATLAALNYLCAYASEHDECALPLAFSELLLLCNWDGLSGEALDLTSQGAAASSSFLQCLSLLASTWRHSRTTYSNAHKGRVSTPQSLSALVSNVLGEFFSMALRMCGVASVDILLRRASAGSFSGAGTANSLDLRSSGSHNTDLCSLKNYNDDLVRTPHGIGMKNDKGVAAFQSCFEGLVMWPLMSLFQSPRTPVVLWSKILAFIAALLQYHALKHGFVTDMLLKFLPDIERGLDSCTVHEAFIDDSLLFDRLALPVLADEVAAKVHALKTSQTGPLGVSGYDARKRSSHIVSILDDDALIGALLEYLVRDTSSCFSQGLPRMPSAPDVRQEQEQGQVDLKSLRFTRGDFLWNKPSGGRRQVALIYHGAPNNATRRSTRNAFEEDGKDQGTASQRGFACSPLTSPVTQRHNGTLKSFSYPARSNRFGEYVYTVHSDVPMQDQMALEYYGIRGVDSISTDAANLEEEKGESPLNTASLCANDDMSGLNEVNTALFPSRLSHVFSATVSSEPSADGENDQNTSSGRSSFRQ